jgi:hypothetical protein
MSQLLSFEAEKTSRLIEDAFNGYLRDPADSDFQRGYLAALIVLYTEGLGKGMGDSRIPLLKLMAGMLE